MPMRMPKGPIEKPKDRKKVLLRLGGYIYAHKWLALGAIGLTAASNLLALLGPMLSGKAIDAIGLVPGGTDFPAVFTYCGLSLSTVERRRKYSARTRRRKNRP